MTYRDDNDLAVLGREEMGEDAELRLEREMQEYIKSFLTHALSDEEIGDFIGAGAKNQGHTLAWLKQKPHYSVFEQCLAEFVSCFWERIEAEERLERAKKKYQMAQNNFKRFFRK